MTAIDDRPLGSCIQSQGDYRRYLELDLRAHGLTRWRAQYFFSKPTLRYQRLLRRVEFGQHERGYLAKLRNMIRRVRLSQLSVRLGLSVPPGVFGPGLSLPHYGSVVVNSKVRAGEFCRVHSATNIGESGGKAPQIGHFVYIGPGAVLYGDIEVGTAAAIGANSVVGRDVPSGCTVAGAPARVVRATGAESVMPEWIVREMEAADA